MEYSLCGLIRPHTGLVTGGCGATDTRFSSKAGVRRWPSTHSQSPRKQWSKVSVRATPRFFTGRVVREAREADFEVASMDNPDTFGPVFHRLSSGEAIERDLLSDYQVAVGRRHVPGLGRAWLRRSGR
jgi:predicted helicase